MNARTGDMTVLMLESFTGGCCRCSEPKNKEESVMDYRWAEIAGNEERRNLSYLSLGSNNLTGNISNEIGTAGELRYLLLNDNNLNGTPKSIGKLQNLIVLDLANNKFEGNIPTEFCSLRDLHILSLKSNKFNGSIPMEISYLHQLRILDLSQNSLNNQIPGSMGNLKKLVSRLNDTFSIDDYVSNFVRVDMMIKGNNVEVEILFSYTSAIDLSCSNLDGNIPKEISLLKRLYMLNLSHNHFSAFLWNDLLCGFPTNKVREGESNTSVGDTNPITEVEEGDQEDANERILFCGVTAIGFGVGFWGLFLILLLKKNKWWFGYWRVIDSVILKQKVLERLENIVHFVNAGGVPVITKIMQDEELGYDFYGSAIAAVNDCPAAFDKFVNDALGFDIAMIPASMDIGSLLFYYNNLHYLYQGKTAELHWRTSYNVVRD
ncbi:receptor-like protein 9DC3 [Papaver somniferum]|uniref:receptor-like protein 9DC3 n=1 Tax=Papaver somniferum TaxID=3469 RepID=UPI000E6FCCEB|nr:receptor-like protein 9DC3 [Papaver somniferum]